MKAIRALKIVLKDTVMSRERAYLEECIAELEALENRSCNNCRNSSFEVKFGELEFNACFLVSNGNVCKWESK